MCIYDCKIEIGSAIGLFGSLAGCYQVTTQYLPVIPHYRDLGGN
jgi:hypothetical protein